jgi:hypothetical protein
LYSYASYTERGDARAHATTTPANLDCLVNKFRARILGTLFIKLELILHEWFGVVVNRTFLGVPSLQRDGGGP